MFSPAATVTGIKTLAETFASTEFGKWVLLGENAG